MVEVWTDGCCMSNPGGVGGWAYAVVHRGEVVKRGWGGDPSTTNNQMEMQAVIEGLNYVAEEMSGESVTVISDSKYVVDGAEVWIHKWKARGWNRRTRTSKRAPVANLSLWKSIDSFRGYMKIKFRWVKGHTGNHYNELVDDLASMAAQELLPDGL